MNKTDRQYLDLLDDILNNGTLKHTRAGDAYSVFDRSMRFDMKDGLPLLTTKKVFIKGVIHELLWFISGNTNIKYLVDNNVNIWTDDAYRYYNELITKNNKFCKEIHTPQYNITPVSKEEFIEKVKNADSLNIIVDATQYSDYLEDADITLVHYIYGELGDIYGKQWRKFGASSFDQIQNIIDTLKNNPDDRRMFCSAYNPDAIYSNQGVALPPCHVFFQVYSREATEAEVIDYIKQTGVETNVPNRVLSLSFTCRSQDVACGTPFNIISYALLLHMIAKVTNMIPGELIYHGMDCHIYANHIDNVKVQLQRTGCDYLPTLKFARDVDNIFDFKYEDFIIENYNPDPAIKFQLNVG